MITGKNITYHINQKILLDNINVEFLPRKLNLIIGPNGAGKSTLIKVLCNQIQPQTGLVCYDGVDIKKISLVELAKTRAVLSQNVELAFPLKVSEIVMMGRYPHFSIKPTAKDKQACEEGYEIF